MNLKKTLPALTLILALIFAVSTATAQPPETGDKKAPNKIAQMSPEDRAAWKEIWQEHRQKVEPLRDQMWAKQMEYDFLLANPNAKQAEVKAVIDEMLRLKIQLRTERGKLIEAAEAKGLDAQMFGRGHDRLWRGHGPDGDFGPAGCGQGKGMHKGMGKDKGMNKGHGGHGAHQGHEAMDD